MAGVESKLGKATETTVLALLLRNKDDHLGSLSPQEQTNFLNGFYEPLIAIILRQDGLLNYLIQTEGGLVTWFGYPSEYQDHSLRALTAARDMVRSITHPLAVSIGIDTGDTVVGNIGTPYKLQFCIVGDIVQRALQIAQVARQREIDILIGDSTLNRVGNTIQLNQSFEVALPERRQITLVHSLAGT